MIEAVRAARPSALLAGAALVVIGLGYVSLLTVGTRYGFEKGVEYWLFRPTDNAPLVIVVLSGWLFYRRWPRLRALGPSTAAWPWIALSVLAATAFHVWAVYTRADDLKIVSLGFAISALVLSIWGTAGLRAVWLPIVFLLFAIPMPAPLLLAIVFKLQIWTAGFAGWLLYAIGVPALVSGDQILRATQTFQVIEGCSGMRSVETLMMLTILLIDLFGRRGAHAVMLIVAAPLVAFFLNGFRVLTLILNPHSEIIAIHNLQGVAILLLGLLAIYGLDLAIERVLGDGEAPDRIPAAGSERRAFSERIASGSIYLLALALSSSSLFVPAWAEGPQPHRLHELVTTSLDEWPSTKVEADFIFRGSVRFGEVVHRRYRTEDGPVTVFVGTADLGQRGGSPLSPITALPGTGWMVRESGPMTAAEAPPAARVLMLEKDKRRVLVQHWYEGSRGLFAETLRSLLALDRSPLKRSEAFFVVRLETPILGRAESDRPAAEARLARVYQRLAPALARLHALVEARD